MKHNNTNPEFLFLPSEGVAGGGVEGEESRHARARIESGPARRPARKSRARQNIFSDLRGKTGRAGESEKQRYFGGQQASACGGGAASIGVLLEMGSNFLIYSPPNLICVFMRLAALPLGARFREIPPGGFEIRQKHSRRKAAVPKRSLDCAFSARVDVERFSEIVGVSAMPLSI